VDGKAANTVTINLKYSFSKPKEKGLEKTIDLLHFKFDRE